MKEKKKIKYCRLSHSCGDMVMLETDDSFIELSVDDLKNIMSLVIQQGCAINEEEEE